jgi:hypothetical protein
VIPLTKIQVKKVQALDFTSDMRLTPPPPKDAPAAAQKISILALKHEIIK